MNERVEPNESRRAKLVNTASTEGNRSGIKETRKSSTTNSIFVSSLFFYFKYDIDE